VARSTSDIAELTVTNANGIGLLVLLMAPIAMESAGAHPSRSARLSGAPNDAPLTLVSVAHTAAIADSHGWPPIPMAQPLTADARIGGVTIE